METFANKLLKMIQLADYIRTVCAQDFSVTLQNHFTVDCLFFFLQIHVNGDHSDNIRGFHNLNVFMVPRTIAGSTQF